MPKPKTTYESAYQPPEPLPEPLGQPPAPPPEGPTQQRLLIAGSREATPAMLAYTRRAVQRAGQLGWAVVVGDNPRGVDHAVVNSCAELGVNCTVYGVQRQPRNAEVTPGEHCRYVQVLGERVEEQERRFKGDTPRYDKTLQILSYQARDRQMVAVADRVLCVWDGASRGTRAVYDYAAALGKPADLMTYDRARSEMRPAASTSGEPAPTKPEVPAGTDVPERSAAPETSPAYPIYTLGYAGRTAEEVAELVESLDATLVDIRTAPRSRMPGFNAAQLTKRLGERYTHLPTLGNVNYLDREQGIRIQDYAAGRDALAAMQGPVILLCGCKDVHSCHRSVVAERLAADGFNVRGDLGELDLAKERALQRKPAAPTPKQRVAEAGRLAAPTDPELRDVADLQTDPTLDAAEPPGLPPNIVSQVTPNKQPVGEPQYAFAIRAPLGGEDTYRLTAHKTWTTPEGSRAAALDLSRYDTQRAAEREAWGLVKTWHTVGCEAAMQQAEQLAVAFGSLAADRPDPRLFTAGPPDAWQTLRAIENSVVPPPYTAETEDEVRLPPSADVDLAEDLADDPAYRETLDALGAQLVHDLASGTLAPETGDDPPAARINELALEACRLGGLPAEDLQELEQARLPFQALRALGLQAVDFDPLRDVPPFYDAETQTAYWVGIYQPDPTDLQNCAAGILSVSRSPEGQADAHLAICDVGYWNDMAKTSEALLGAVREGGIDRALGMAEGIAHVRGQRETWRDGRGAPLEAPYGEQAAAAAEQRPAAHEPEL